MKYIMIDGMGDAEPAFFIFPDCKQHSIVANQLGYLNHVTGAGFIQFVDEGRVVAECYGESNSLRVGVGVRDSVIITKFLAL